MAACVILRAVRERNRGDYDEYPISQKRREHYAWSEEKIRIPRKIAILCALALLIAAAAGIGIFLHVMQRSKQQTVYAASYLKSIILKSDLSTRSAVYSGIAEVHNPESPDKIDYYVSYKANVKTGINFES